MREDACPGDPGKLFAGVCGCGTPDDDPDRDGTPDCLDGCPRDAAKLEPGVCGCGAVDTDADGTPDCHDPATSQALRALVQQAIAVAKTLTAADPDRAATVGQLQATAVWFTAAENNSTLSRRQRQLLGVAAQALGDLADATGRSVARKRRKTLAILRKLLKKTRR